MTKQLFIKAISKFIMGVLAVGLLIFWPAGTLQYTNGWLFMGILFVPMFFAAFSFHAVGVGIVPFFCCFFGVSLYYCKTDQG